VCSSDLAIMPNIKEVTVFDQFGKMSIEECTQAIELAQAGCVTMHKFVKNCLLVNTTSS
jgi:ribonuclease PH